MRVFVLDGNENQAVACVRSLARAGRDVYVGADSSWSKAGWSRHARGAFRYPAPQRDAEGFVARVVEEVERAGRGSNRGSNRDSNQGSNEATLVMPMTERTTLPLSAERQRIFDAGGRLVLPSHETLLRAFDKRETTRLAASLGVTVPRTEALSERAGAKEFAEGARYPVVLKPRTSEELTADGKVRATGSPVYARDAGEFINAFDELKKRCAEVLAQEFVEGSGAGYFALMNDGELRCEFAHRRIRDVRPTGSGSAVRESVAVAAEIREAGLAILKALKWHGVAMVEFRVRADGTPVFLEVNGRFWNSLPLAVYAGADFPAAVAEMAERGDVKASFDYREGVRCRWLLGDFRHTLEVMRGAPEGFPGAFPKRLKTLTDFLTPVAGTYHDNLSLSDPLPELGDWLDFLFRRLPARARRRDDADEDVHAQRRFSLP